MSIHAVVPLKCLSMGKRRLTGTLSPIERAELIRAMSQQVLSVLLNVETIAQVSVLTNDRSMVPHTCTRIDDPGPDLNAAVSHAGRVVVAAGATSMLVISADLPYVTGDDIRHLIEASRECAIVIAPDVRGEGTNAMLLTPPTVFATSFGAGSLAAHKATSRLLRMSTAVIHRAGLERDIDEPASLVSLAEQGGSHYSFLQRLSA